MKKPEFKPNGKALGCYVFFIGMFVWLNIFQYAGVIDWSIWWRVAPLWIPFVLALVLNLGVFLYVNVTDYD